jgi:plastocyanin
MPGRSTSAAARYRWAVALAAAALLGCGGGGSSTSGSSASTAPSAHRVVIKGYAYDPDPVTVSGGTTVTWKNDDHTEHTATAADGSFDTGTIKGNGGTGKVVLNTPGTYDYMCEFHQFMKGTITVTG